MLINVIDLEATCWESNDVRPHDNDGPVPSEIIQIGVVTYDTDTHKITEPYTVCVRPTRVESLSEFCKILTGLTDKQVFEGGISFLDAMSILQDKFTINRRTLVSWGMYDYMMLREALETHKGNIRRDLTNRHLNLKSLASLFGYRSGALLNAVQEAGLDFEGSWHDAGSDALNTARLLRVMMREIRQTRDIRSILEAES